MRIQRCRLNVKRLREKFPAYKHNYPSLRVVSELAGLSYDTVQCWILGKRKDHTDQSYPDIARARRFAAAAKIPFEELWEKV